MAARYFIVVGDPTTGGGEAVEGYSGWKVECQDGTSRGVVRVGDQVVCGQCGPTTAVEGYPFAFVPNALLAYDDCRLACGHKLISKMQRLFSWDDPSPSTRTSSSESGPTVTRFATAAGNASMFDEAFILRSKATGRPLANRRYRITRDSGVESGVTDENGATHLVVSDSIEDLVIHLQEEGP